MIVKQDHPTRRYVPESIRWLVSQNRGQEAVEVLKDISKTNNKPLDVNLDFILNRVSMHSRELVTYISYVLQ